MDKHIHIVCLDVPYPANYGGVVDLFYKIKSLYNAGVKIHLHCFTKSREPQEELNKYCESVSYYDRKKGLAAFSFSLPQIVKSRIHDRLIKALQQDDHPVLLEGIHCTYYLKTGQLSNRKVIVRLHNAEFAYYRQLAKHEKNLFKKLYFLNESRLLKKYEKNIAKSTTLLAVSQQDAALYRQAFNAASVQYLPVFTSYDAVKAVPGKGCYCLYHGNLAISENEAAATWLLKKVFNKITLPLVIAGKNPSKKLAQLAHAQQHTCLVANPTDKEMQDMIGKAHVHVLPSFNNTGIKLKLLNALFNGRHCLVNQQAVEDTGLAAFCHIADDATAFQKNIEELFGQPFTEQEVEARQHLLQTTYNNEANTRELIKFLW